MRPLAGLLGIQGAVSVDFEIQGEVGDFA